MLIQCEKSYAIHAPLHKCQTLHRPDTSASQRHRISFAFCLSGRMCIFKQKKSELSRSAAAPESLPPLNLATQEGNGPLVFSKATASMRGMQTSQLVL